MAVDPETLAAATLLVKAQADSREQVSSATQGAVAATVRAFLSWGDRDAVTRMAKALAASTRAGQKQTATGTAAYWARIVSLVTGRRVQPSRLVDVTKVRPVPLDVVYGRLADQYRWLDVSRGPDTTPEVRLGYAVQAWRRDVDRWARTADTLPSGFQVPREPTVPPGLLTRDQILDRVVTRAEVVADTSLTLTMRAQLEQAAKKDPRLVTGYRRVIHPELSAGGTCGLCVAASTRVYYVDNLLPIHGRCRCTVTPMIGKANSDGDIGGAINESDLPTLYRLAGGTTAGAALKRTRFRVVDHPETGKQLVSGDTAMFLAPQGA